MKLKISEMKTKMGATILLIILFVFLGQPSAMGVSLQIDSVDVIPNQPLDTDIITFNISGWAATSPSGVESDLFSQNGTSLQLDLYIERGIQYSLSNWTYSKQISPLPSDVYNLQVRAFDFIDGTLQDTYNVDFTVVPEPATFVLFLVGAGIIRNRNRN
jgi:hypothetical protein